MSVITGQFAESQARAFLEKNGLRFLEQNYRCRGGEIDLIMQDEDYYVFVEVRMRQNPGHGSGTESITRGKQRRIIRSALHYLQKIGGMDKVDCRFDVLAIDTGEISWTRDAFQV